MRESIKTKDIWGMAQGLLPGGVNSPVRAFRAVGGEPVFVKAGKGAYLVAEDGKKYLDFMGSWGPLILGHAHPAVVRGLKDQAGKGTSFGAVSALEVELAEAIVGALPHVEKVRLVNSGTEAAMSAVRLARAATGRSFIIKAEGGYHGHSDGMLVRAGSGAETFGAPDSAGVTEKTASETLTVRYNDLGAMREAFASHPNQIAAVIVEPILGNMGLIPPQEGFLDGLRGLTRDQGALLIFDEVITGFRLRYGDAAGMLGVTPDLTVLGKIIGGGLPLAAFGGSAKLMDMLAPLGPVYQAGTLSGNPLATRCGIETLKVLARKGVYGTLERNTQRLTKGIADALTGAGIAHQLHQVGSMFCVFFTDQPVTDAASARNTDTALYKRWFWALQRRGVYLPPSAYETCFVSLAHGPKEIAKATKLFSEAAKEIA